MAITPLHIAIIWHMHQPYYKAPDTGEYVLPWVRLHAIKDYYDMVSILEDFPSVHQTFNLTPSLLEQLEDYAYERAKDIYLNCSTKPPQDLSLEEKTFILENFFMANRENMVKPFPRYWELLTKRGDTPLSQAVRYFSNQDILDLQVWFNLSWFDPVHRERDGFLKAMVEKDRNFTQEEKEVILRKQIEIIKMIIPKYKEKAENGIIELSFSPFYHPILPLLCDSYSAREALPEIKLPLERFRHPEDAIAQIRMGIKYFENLFNYKPSGCWPPEGSVSNELIPFFIEEAIQWIATDEGVLSKSINHIFRRDNKGLCLEPEVLYKPYFMEYKGKKLNILFRDHILSDLISFVYSKWNTKDAINDLTNRLYKIRERLIERTGNVEGFIVPIILDGENPWEHYKNDGRDFLRGLYSTLESNPDLKPVTVKEHLQYAPPDSRLQRLFAGSWIDHNFKIWIGHSEDNAAWEQLIQARKALSTHTERISREKHHLSTTEEKSLQEAWKTIYIAEGSDWFWWYGEEHSSAKDREFDDLFRKNLKRVYQLIEKTPPPSLDIPILTEDKV